MDDTPDHPKESFSPEIAHYYPLSKKKKRISKKSQKQTYYRPKKSKKFSIIRRDMREKKGESNHASSSSTLTTFWANNSFVFGRYLLFFVKKSKQHLPDKKVRSERKSTFFFGGVGWLTHGERRISPKLLYKLKFARTLVGLHHCGLEKLFDFVLKTQKHWVLLYKCQNALDFAIKCVKKSWFCFR